MARGAPARWAMAVLAVGCLLLLAGGATAQEAAPVMPVATPATPAADAAPATTAPSTPEAVLPAAAQPAAQAAPETTQAAPATTPEPAATPAEATPAAAAVAVAAVPAAAAAPAAAAEAKPAAEEAKPAEATKPAEEAKPVEEAKPAEEATPVVAEPVPAPVPVAAAPAPPAADEPQVDPLCKAVPGCLACTPRGGAPSSGTSRKLMQGGAEPNLMTAKTTSGKPTINFDALVNSPYDKPDLPVCTSCGITGYTIGTAGKCNCLPGYGDLMPSGTCNVCPDGFISLGGHRAVCVECQNVAWSNRDNTACVCASGWYGYTNIATKQATCNQCPGTRPVSKEGARSAAECTACAAGTAPNEIFSGCVTAVAAPPPPPRTLADVLNASAPVSAPPPPVPKVYNASTFANAKQDWALQSRSSTETQANPFTELLGSVMDSLITGKQVASGAATPGDLLYKVISKPAPEVPRMAEIANNLAGLASLPGGQPLTLETLTALGSSLGALAGGAGGGAGGAGAGALAALPQVAAALAKLQGGGAAGAPAGELNAGQLLNMAGSVLKQLDTASKLRAGAPAPAAPAPASGGGLNQLLGAVSGLSGLLKPVATAAAPAPAAPVVTAASVLADAAKTASGFVKVPGVAPKSSTGFKLPGLGK
ncbi:von Willebrand factor A domain-containing protein [Scenedesmus sp. PABB004]|nr:von Willebrand factor A domain-containing protein [Scenedesmus sp. PABB004]